MKTLRRLFFYMCIIGILYVGGQVYFSSVNKTGEVSSGKQMPPKEQLIVDGESIRGLIGKNSSEVEKRYGTPTNKFLSAYKYEWWIYNEKGQKYFQVGIAENTVVTCYEVENVGGKETTYDVLNQQYNFKEKLAFHYKGNQYEAQFSKEDMSDRPIVNDNGVWIQFYFDRFTKELSSIRYMDTETFLTQRPYSLTYTGKLLSPPRLSMEEKKIVDSGDAKQIWYISNVIRKRHGLGTLEWNEKVAGVAFLHSKDMKEQGYFSHVSPTEGELKDRLQKGSVRYQLAGENIASKYVDGIAAVEAWMNSEGHRENMLNPAFQSIGVGVDETFYTQNFVKE